MLLKEESLWKGYLSAADQYWRQRQLWPEGGACRTGVLGIASDLVTVGKGYENLASYLLGRTLVVDHIDHAIAIGKKYRHSLRMVTIEGESLNPGGSMTGGAFRNNSNLLGRRREIEELQACVERLKEEMRNLQETMEGSRERRNQLRDELAGLKELVQEQCLLENTVRMEIQQKEEKQRKFPGVMNRSGRKAETFSNRSKRWRRIRMRLPLSWKSPNRTRKIGGVY
mgnify:CR=1 FL=1